MEGSLLTIFLENFTCYVSVVTREAHSKFDTIAHKICQAKFDKENLLIYKYV